ncbi:MAG: hypothetical protein JWP87_223 [Labilithrix sp.]|jgi:hypothetical protein|nr:hypothetical protein [Labilithrix sp.]
MNEPYLVHEVCFVAPVPHGHDALVVTLRRSEGETSTCSFVLDQTDGILYCDEDLWSPFGSDPLATRDPLAVLAKWSWVVAKSTTGTVIGSIVSTKDGGDQNHARTRIFVTPKAAGQPYRG